MPDPQGLRRMLVDIDRELRYTRDYIGQDAFSERVMTALAQVPRHYFVPPELQDAAYDNGPLPIGHGQTISQPYIVALMTDLLRPRPDDVVLEVGTGSGYQTAVLARLVRQVYSLEVVAALAAAAGARLQQLGCSNVEVHHSDGYAGWPEHAPYDGIIVTAAAPYVPAALIAQLKPGARLVIPVGDTGGPQELLVVEKDAAGAITQRAVLPVAFVPLVQM
ncbi:MAG: protein-L-isoaspartate(D-aspartate) O-methyltransferase [Thiohalomonadaceae bacterium]